MCHRTKNSRSGFNLSQQKCGQVAYEKSCHLGNFVTKISQISGKKLMLSHDPYSPT
jgi:hypothetical protein